MAHAHGSLHSVNGKRVHPAVHEEPRSLDELAELTVEELSHLYAQGKPPQLGVLAGVTRGRLLAIAGVDTLPLVGPALASLVRKISAMRLMPWRGKTFAAPAEHHRTAGRNRWFELEAMPFDAHVEKSALDHQPTLVLSYDRPENPAPLRALHDELREIARGLYMGPAYVRGPNGPRVLAWWACVKE